MKEKLLIIGAGGHARSVIDVALLQDKYDIIGCVDNDIGKKVGINDIKVICSDGGILRILDKGITNAFIAIGNNTVRDKLAIHVANSGFKLVNIVSPISYISKHASIGCGICVMHGVVINVNTTIGNNCIINTGASIDHDCRIGSSVHIAPGVTLSGSVDVGNLTHIGTGSSVIDRLMIGNNVYIGAGSVVVADIESDKMAYGVPAKIIKDNI